MANVVFRAAQNGDAVVFAKSTDAVDVVTSIAELALQVTSTAPPATTYYVTLATHD